MATAKITTDMIKPFTGEGDVVAWVRKVKLVAKLKKVTDVASLLPLYLEGDALSIYLEMKESDQDDADKIEARLKEAFSDSAFVAYGKLMHVKWVGEQVDVFANEIRRLAGLAGFTGESLERIVKLTFVNGLPEHMSVELQQVENIMELSMSDVLTRARILTANRDNISKMAAVSVDVDKKSFTVGKAVQHGSREGEVRKFKGQCYRCGGPHMARFCKEQRTIICYRCGKEGHIAPRCNQVQGNEQRGAVAPAATPSVE